VILILCKIGLRLSLLSVFTHAFSSMSGFMLKEVPTWLGKQKTCLKGSDQVKPYGPLKNMAPMEYANTVIFP